MGRNRQPARLIRAKGRKHMSAAEYRERLEHELQVDLTDVAAPEYLPAKLSGKFYEIAAKLLHVGIFTELDEDVLARYLIAEDNYLCLTSLLGEAIAGGDADEIAKVQRSQNAQFNQCHTCASALGLTITSRCKLVVPDAGEEHRREDKFAKFEK